LALARAIVLLYGLILNKRHGGWTAAFLITTILTSVTGFPLPATQLLPSHITGLISIVLLAVAVVALYVFHLKDAWRWIYVVPR
jgi:hypothetical protein